MITLAIACTIATGLICLVEITTSNRQSPGRRQK